MERRSSFVLGAPNILRMAHGKHCMTTNNALLTDAYLALRASFGAANRER
jgi:hypothetical protein